MPKIKNQRRLPTDPGARLNYDNYGLRTGMPKWKNLVIVRGYIGFLPKKTYALLRSGNAVLRLRFFMNKIPPGVRDMDRITVVGHLATYNLGGISIIRNALHIPGGYAKLVSGVREVIAHYRLDPKEYIGPEEITDGFDEGIHLPGTRDV